MITRNIQTVSIICAGVLSLALISSAGAAEVCYKTTFDLGDPKNTCQLIPDQREIDRVVWNYCVDDQQGQFQTPSEMTVELFDQCDGSFNNCVKFYTDEVATGGLPVAPHTVIQFFAYDVSTPTLQAFDNWLDSDLQDDNVPQDQENWRVFPAGQTYQTPEAIRVEHWLNGFEDTCEGDWPGHQEYPTLTQTTEQFLVNLIVEKTQENEGVVNSGDILTYIVTIENDGNATQPDNPGPEFVDILPATLNLHDAFADSGETTVDKADNTIYWNGEIAVNQTISITIRTLLSSSARAGDVIENQGVAYMNRYGESGNSTERVSVPSDDPNTAPEQDPTRVTVASIVPTLSIVGLIGLFALLMGAGVRLSPRRRA